MKSLFVRFAKNESGATAIEYGLIAAVMGVAVVVAFGYLAGGLKDGFQTIATKLTTETGKM